jgi:nicotinamide mononucleotide (NMN) deamidase PncC
VPGKPVGTVWLALAWSAPSGSGAQVECLQLNGGRSAVRGQTVTTALQRLIDVALA